MTTKRTLTSIAGALILALAAAPALADEREDSSNDCIAAGGDRESCYAQFYGDDNGDDDSSNDCIAAGGDRESCYAQFYGDDNGDEGGDSDPVTRIAEWLEMSQDQIEEWQWMLEAMHETLQQPLEQLPQLEEQYRAEIWSENPDRELIGQLVLEMEDLRFEIGTVQTQAIADMVIVLTAEQTDVLAGSALFEMLMGGDSRNDDR